jgi:hypothetical protein
MNKPRGLWFFLPLLTIVHGCVPWNRAAEERVRQLLEHATVLGAKRTDDLVNLRSLDTIVTVGFIAAAVLFVLWAMKLPIPPRAPLAAFAAAFIALLCRAFLNAFLWPTMVAAAITVAIVMLALLRTNWRLVKAMMTCDPDRKPNGAAAK